MTPDTSTSNDRASRGVRLRRLALLTAAILVPAACSPAADTPRMSSHAVAVATLQKVNTQAHQCWLTDADFKAYGIIPELDTTGTPRILLIPRGKPRALPNLVIAANGSALQVYGPLAASPLAPRISADVSRWSKGAVGCTA